MIINIEKMTPDVYCSESRDFQLLCRLYDCIFSGVKSDVDSIPNILNTTNIMSSMLPLLKTKLGFLSSTNLNDDELRYILNVFPYIIRAKGSLKAIKEMINMCLKLYNVAANFKIERVNGESVINSITLDTHSILIGIDTVLRSTNLLKELCNYVMPPGFTMYVYFYTELPLSETYDFSDNIELLFTSDNINSLIYTHPHPYASTGMSYNVGDLVYYNDFTFQCNTAITSPAGEWDINKWDLIFINQRELELTLIIDLIYVGSSEINLYTLWKGILSKLPTSGRKSGDVVLVKDKLYYYNRSAWNELKYCGKYISFPKYSDIGSISSNQIPIIEIIPLTNSKRTFLKSYYRFYNGSWYKLNSRGSINESLIITPSVNDFVAIKGAVPYAKYCSSTSPIKWLNLNTYQGEIDYLPDNYVKTKIYNVGDRITETDGIYVCNTDGTTGNFDLSKWTLNKSLSNNDYYYLCKPAYYMYVGNGWYPCTDIMYTLAYNLIGVDNE